MQENDDENMGIFSAEPLRYDEGAVPRRFVDALGPRAAFLGRESGTFEAWIWPLKICRELKLGFRTEGRQDPIEAASIVTNVEVAPHKIVLSYAHQDFTVHQTLAASGDDRLLLMILDVDVARPITIEVSFVPEFLPMWPASLGGQIVRVDESTGAILLTEELGRYAALIGSPDARARVSVDRGLPREPLRLEIPVDFDRAEEGPVVFVLAGAEVAAAPLDDAAKLGRKDAACGAARLERVVDQARVLFRTGVVAAQSIVEAHQSRWLERLDGWSSFGRAEAERVYWAGIAITKAWAEVDGLGRGLLAGLAPSGNGQRPGFGWFFDGDAMTAGDAMGLLGDSETPAAVLRRAASHQNAAGKMMHELTLAARLCDWFEDFPYAYYKSENTAAFLVYLGAHVRRTDDRALAAELAAAAGRAVEWIAGQVDDDGLFSIPRAGLGAVEAGPLAAEIRAEVYSQGLVIAGLRAYVDLYDDAAAGAAVDARALLGRVEAAFETFWSESKGRYGFAVLTSGELLDDLSGYLGLPLALGVGRKDRAERTAAALNRPDLATEWGLRMFAASSRVYDPSHYNTGSVFPYLQGFAVRGLYAHGQLEAARQALDSLLGLHGFEALGMIPEHLVGDRCVVPERGVPHQIFSSSALIHALVLGSIGYRQSAATHLLELAPAISDRYATIEVLCERLKSGRDRVILDFDDPVGDDLAVPEAAEEPGGVDWPPKKKKAGKALPPPFDLSCRVDIWDGYPATTLRFAPLFPAHTKLISAQVVDASGRPRRLKTTIETLGQATVIACEDVHVASEALVTLRVRRGPHFLQPPLGNFFPGSRSRAMRYCFERIGANDVSWTIWGEAGAVETLDVRSDRACEWSGGRFDESRGTLELDFPKTPGAEWVTVVVTARILD